MENISITFQNVLTFSFFLLRKKVLTFAFTLETEPVPVPGMNLPQGSFVNPTLYFHFMLVLSCVMNGPSPMLENGWSLCTWKNTTNHSWKTILTVIFFVTFLEKNQSNQLSYRDSKMIHVSFVSGTSAFCAALDISKIIDIISKIL